MSEHKEKFFSQTDAKNQFLELCRQVIATREKLYVKDKSGFTFLTIAPTIRRDAIPLVEVSAQRFKDDFSRFCYLVKDGFSFRLRLKGTSEVAYVRGHSSYKDPLSDVVQQGYAQLRGLPPTEDMDEDDAA